MRYRRARSGSTDPIPGRPPSRGSAITNATDAHRPEGEQKLTILMGGDTFAPDVNGAASFSLRLAAGLASRGHDLHIIAQSHDGKQGAFREEHLGQTQTVHRLKSFRWPLHDWLRAVYPWAIHGHARRII
jgi:hypothetical protein